MNYTEELRNIHELALTLEKETEILKSVDYWTTGFIKYTNKAERVNLLNEEISQEKFNDYLSKFLWSPNGARFQKNFRFERDIECGKPAPPITVSLTNSNKRRESLSLEI